MNALLAYPVALGIALPTTLGVLGLWVGHARVVRGDSVDSVLLSFVFLLVPLIFGVSAASNLGAVALGQLAGLVVPGAQAWLTIAGAGVLVWCGSAWTQRGFAKLFDGSGPVSAGPVALFSLADMIFLAGGLRLLSGPSTT